MHIYEDYVTCHITEFDFLIHYYITHEFNSSHTIDEIYGVLKDLIQDITKEHIKRIKSKIV